MFSRVLILLLAGACSPLAGLQVDTKDTTSDIRYRQVQDVSGKYEIVVDAKTPATVTIAPSQFAIRKGSRYRILTSHFPLPEQTALEDGKLAIVIPQAVRNCTILVEEDTSGGNLIANSSFEKLTANFQPENWILNMDEGFRAMLAWGHESLSESTPFTSDSGSVAETLGQIRKQAAFDGQQYISLKKPEGQENLTLTYTVPVPLEAGKEYLFSHVHRLRELPFGSTLHAIVTVTAPGKPPLNFRDHSLNPLTATGNAWERSFFQFKVPEDYANASAKVWFSLQGAPVALELDAVELVEAPSPVVQYPVALSSTQMEGIYSDDEVLRLMEKRPPVEARVIQEDGKVYITINGQKVPMFGFTPGPSLWPKNADHKAFTEAGVKLQWIPLWSNQNGVNYGKPIWLGNGKYDFKPVDELLREALRQDPERIILFYLGLFSYPEMGDQHPDAIWRSPNGKKTVGTKRRFREMEERPKDPKNSDDYWNISYTSEVFRREASDFLEALGRHLQSSPLGRAVAGVHLVCGADGQWFGLGEVDHQDRSPHNLAAFRNWLRQVYKNDEAALRKAWNDPEVTFAGAQLPEESERATDDLMLNLGMGAHRRIYDANRFSSMGVTETINQLAGAFKKGMSRPTLVSVYYHDILHNHMTNHWSLRELLDGPNLDGIVSVASYGLWRKIGRVGDYNSSIGSIRLAGKFYLNELDYRTDLSWLRDGLQYRWKWGVPLGAENWINQLRRDFGMVLAQGQGAWYYALGGNGLADEASMQGIAEAVRAARLANDFPQPEDHGQIAIFCDEEIQDRTSRKEIFGAALSMVAYNLVRVPLSRSGVTWDAYLLSDLDNPKRAAYKINILLSAVSLTEKQVRWIEENLQKDGNIIIVINTMGTPSDFSEITQRITGIRATVEPDKVGVRRFRSAKGENPLAYGWEYLHSETRSLLYSVRDSEATPLAYYTDGSRVGAAVKKAEAWTGIYIGLPGALTPTFLRGVAKQAGLTPIGPEGDATYAGNGFLTLHALTAGEKELQWQEPCDIYDLTKGEIIARNTRKISFVAKLHETRWFQKRPPEKLP